MHIYNGICPIWGLKLKKGVLLIGKEAGNVIVRYLGVVLYQLIIYFNDIKSTDSEIFVKAVGNSLWILNN